MQLNGTHIAVRERGTGELLDLALLVLRYHFGQLLLWFCLPSLVLLALNALLLNWELHWMSEREQGPRLAVYWIACLSYLQAPLATSCMTVYLARKMFQDDSGFGSIVKAVRDRLGQLLWYHGICRHWFLVVLLIGGLSGYDDPTFQVSCVTLAVALSMIFRLGYPYLNEVILLERNPWWPKDKRLSTYRRNDDLHRGSLDYSLRMAILKVFIVPFGLWMLIKLMSVGSAILMSRVPQNHYFFLAAFYLALAGLSIYFAIVRFLGYLDLRIRREGWEVDILLRGAAGEMQPRHKPA